MEQFELGRTLSDSEAAKYIGKSASWLRQARSTGNPEAPSFLKIGRNVRDLRSDLDTWLQTKRRRNTLEA